MLPRERVPAALNHREPDRIPWGEHSIDYNVYEAILGRSSFVQAKMRETQALWDGRRDEVVASYKRDRLDLVRALDMDILAVHSVPAAGVAPEPMEQIDEQTYRDRHGKLCQVSAITHDLLPLTEQSGGAFPADMAELESAVAALDSMPADDPGASEWDLVRHAVREMKSTHFILLLCGDVSFPLVGANEADGWMNLVLRPELGRKAAELAGRRLLRQLPLYARLGVDGIMPCGDLGSSTSLMASPAIYRDMVHPWHRRIVTAAHELGLRVLKHCCGHIWPVIDELAELYDAYEGIQASAGMDIRLLKERVGNRLCLWGGVWHEHLIHGTPHDIRADASYAFRHAGPGGGYIMGSSHSLAVGAQPRNILEMKRCRDNWGHYPLTPGSWRQS